MSQHIFHKKYLAPALLFAITMVLQSCGPKEITPNPTPPPPSSDTTKNVATINSTAATLSFNKIGSNTFYPLITSSDGNTIYQQPKPLVAEFISSSGSASWVDAPYTELNNQSGNIVCKGTVAGSGGARLSFTDTYSKSNADGSFEVQRKVTVTTSGTETGFSTRMGFQKNSPSNVYEYDYFVPSVWYQQNSDVPSTALASSLNDEFYWFREDRLPLPIFMLREKVSGKTFSVYHKDADGATFGGEDGLSRIIDGRMKFASVGMQNKNRPLIGITFPGTEGERTGIYGMAAQGNRWAYRSHPATAGFEQNYKAVFSLTQESDYFAALKNTWQKYFTLANPAIYNVNLTTVYDDQIALLNRYWKQVNTSYGFPFRIALNGNAASTDYNWNMGFVGQQLPNASLLIREGFVKGDAALRTKGEQIIDWWAANAIHSNGALKTWYDPAPQTWRTAYPTYMRVAGDGMLGVLWAWKFEKNKGINKPSWLQFCTHVADWLLTKQNTDGSFPRSINYTNNTIVDAQKTNTSHIIPFLVELFFATDNHNYKQAAVNAGNYVYNDSYQNLKYIGGTPDNPNVPDKEAASMALRAYLALYDATKDSKWKDAAAQAATYYQTWIYSWNVPIPVDETVATYPPSRGTTGLSIVAVSNNACDTYAAIDAFNFYRMYLYTGDGMYLNTAKLCLYNTRQALNWDRSVATYGDPGICVEAMNLVPRRGSSVGYFLPWQSYTFTEPIVLLKDVFGSYDISAIELMGNKNVMHDAYGLKRGY